MKSLALVILFAINGLSAPVQADSKKEVKPSQSVVLKPGEAAEAAAESLVSYDAYLVDDPSKPVPGKGQGESEEKLQVFELKDGQILVFQSPDTYAVDENWTFAPLELVISNTSKDSHKLRLSVECIKNEKNLDLDIPAGKVLTFGPWLRKKLACREDVGH